MSDTREAFNPEDPFDASTDDLRRATVMAAVFHAENHPAYKLLPPEKKYETMLIGMLVGTVGCALTHLKEGSDEVLMETITSYLPTALEFAHTIQANGEAQIAAQEAKH